MRLIDQLMQSILNACKAIAEPVLSMPIEWMGWASLVPIILWLVGSRLSLVVKPERPYLSPVLRSFGKVGKWLGLICILGELFGFLVLIGLLYLHQLLAGEHSMYAIRRAWMFVYNPGSEHILRWGEGFLLGAIASLPIVLYYIPRWERGDGFRDVEELVARFKKLNGYDPRKYINIKKGCFIGRTLSGKPIYVPWRKLRETHVQVLGTTGCGKGVAMTLVAYQCILSGECAIWFDPKFDRFTPRILQSAAKLAGREFHMLNLNHGSGPQLNPLLGANQYQIAELFVSAFDLKGKGTDGDYHRGKDVDAATEAASIAMQMEGLSIPGLFKKCAAIKSITEQENFWRRFRQLISLPAVNTEAGLDLADAIANRDVIYLVGDTENEQVKMLQKMLLVRIMQIIKCRKRLDDHAPTCIVLDEFKHMLSPAALTSLGVVRDFDVHILLAHQSMGDLESCPGIEPAEAYGAVVDNTALKIIYKIGDADYAEKLAKLSGKRRTYVDSSAKNLDDNGATTGSWREDKVDHIEMSMITHLPMPSDRKKQASTGLLFGIGNAQLFFVGPIAVPKNMPMPNSIVAPPYCDASTGESVSELI
jgi:hypothetical protein